MTLKRTAIPGLCAVLVLVWAAGRAGSAPASGPKKVVLDEAAKQTLTAYAGGTYDMSKSPRPHAVYLILDQKDNLYPSFWCGHNQGGKITFDTGYDSLDEAVRFSQSGSFTVQIANAAHKKGMSDVLPGGAWIDGLRELEFRITFDSITDAVLKESKKTRVITGKAAGSGNESSISFDVKVGGTVSVGGKRARFKGTGVLGFLGGAPAFTFQTRFAFPGKELGLEGVKGADITATLYTSSTITRVKPKTITDDKGDNILEGLL